MPRREIEKRVQHILELKVAMPALNALINKRPYTIGVLLGNRAELAEKSHRSKMQRTALLVEKRVFRTIDSVSAKRGIDIAKTSQHVKAFPACLCLRTR